jgi:DNA repair exonuclease SbcCD ATPase subunit
MLTIHPYNDTLKIKKIYHISDIHIRNTDKHIIIYNHVFNNLYKYIDSIKDENSIIVITGDILHNKDKLSPVCEKICVDFLTKLSNMLPTIIIAGNHDFNMKNNSILDSLYILLYNRKIKNLYYLQNTGVYRFYNILFFVSSIINSNDIINANIQDKIYYDDFKIALYHGAINNTVNSVGFEFSGKSITVFDGYDYVLLGDIHKFQYLNDNKNIAYASSLISQCFSETDIYHGVLVWDLENNKSDYYIIQNDYRYVELNINDDLIYNDLPPFGELRLNYNDCDRNIYNKIIFHIKQLYPNINIYHNKLLIKNNYEENLVNDTVIDDIINYEINKVPEYLRNKIKDELSECLKYEMLNSNIKNNFELLYLEFSDMFIFGKINKFDFTKLTYRDINGLIAPNSYGKSAFIDIILFALFDNYSRNYVDKFHKRTKYGGIINSNQKYFKCSIKFKYNSDIYEIFKSGHLQSAKSDYTFTTFKYDTYNFIKNYNISLNGTTKDETFKNIINIIGTYEQFILSSICLQFSNKLDFYNMSSVDRKNLLNNIINYDVFKNIEEKYKNKNKELSINKNFIEKSNEYINYNHNTNKLIKNIKKNIKNNNINLLLYNTFIDNYKLEKNKCINLLKYIDDEFNNYSIDDLNNKLIELESINDNIKLLNIDFNTNIIQENINIAINIKSNIQNYNIDDLNIQKNNLIDQINIINNKINKFKFINNKDIIIQNNNVFEINRKIKIVELNKLLTIRNPKYKSKINNIIIDIINDMYNLYDINYDNNYIQIIENYKSKIKIYLDKINYLTTKIIQIDDNIYIPNNYHEYFINTTNQLKKYDQLYNNYIIAKANKNILILFENFNKCINNNCSNCINHYNNIQSFYNKLNISSDYSNIIKQFQYIKKLKYEFNIIQQILYNNKINNLINKYNQNILFFEEINQYYYNQINYINNKIIIKNNLQSVLVEYEQNNIFYDILYYENIINDEFINLNNELSLFDTFNNELMLLNNQLNNINNTIDDYHNFTLINNNNDKLIYINQFNNNNILIDKIKNIHFNKDINDKIKFYDNKIYQYENIINDINNVNIEYKYKLKELFNNKNKYYELYNKIIDIDELLVFNKYIIKLTGPTGIPKKIINIKLKQLQKEVNNIIYSFINKNIIITTDINEIKVFIDNNNSKINFGGGMELFIINLAFKIAFINVFNIPHSGILFIDEGVSVLDRDHVNKFNIIIDFLIKYYNYIILITHNESFNDYISTFIHINKNKNNTSKLLFI